MYIKCCMIAAMVAACILPGAAADRTFGVRDSIAMTRFSEPSGRSRGASPLTSPDGKYFVVVTSRGLLESNKVESSIWLFKNRLIERFLQADARETLPGPALLAKASVVPLRSASDAYQSIIWDLHWSPDSRAIYFLQQGPTGQRQLWRKGIETQRLEKLSPANCDVERFSVERDVVVFYASQNARASENYLSSGNDRNQPAARSVIGTPIYNILFPVKGGSLVPRIHHLWVAQGGRVRQLPESPSSGPDLDHYWDVLSISPDGRFVIQIRPVAIVPSSWESYIPVPGREDWKLDHNDPKITSPSYLWRARQYVLVDLANGKVHPLIDAPYGDVLAHLEATQAVWASDGKRVLLTNTFLPLDGAVQGQQAMRKEMCAVADVQIQSGRAQCIAITRDATLPTAFNPKPLELEKASLGLKQDEVILHFEWPQDKRGQTEWYQNDNGVWTLVKTLQDGAASTSATIGPQLTASTISVRIGQALNEPPVLWATDNRTGRGREIWNPNPQFNHVSYGEASIFHWKDGTGYQWTGGLIKPLGFVAGKRYPLIIQTHGFLDFEFMTDGQYPSGMAARPLASEGFMVLQIQTNYTHVGELAEADDNVRGYESAIAQLASDGLVDPNRVGIVGFSRTSWYVETALIKNPILFAAASISDGTDQSYMQEMLYQLDRVSEGQQMYSATPFGKGLVQWMELAPSFHLDEVVAPVMISALGPPSILEEWEIYASLYKQRKPIEFMYIPDDQHIVQKPMARLASEQSCIDWFQFWLQDYERPRPDDPEQYARWRHLREMRNIQR